MDEMFMKTETHKIPVVLTKKDIEIETRTQKEQMKT